MSTPSSRWWWIVCRYARRSTSSPSRGRHPGVWADHPARLIAIPTTTGAELTPFFGMTDPHARQKQGAGGRTCAPIAVYDVDVTMSRRQCQRRNRHERAGALRRDRGRRRRPKPRLASRPNPHRRRASHGWSNTPMTSSARCSKVRPSVAGACRTAPWAFITDWPRAHGHSARVGERHHPARHSLQQPAVPDASSGSASHRADDPAGADRVQRSHGTTHPPSCGVPRRLDAVARLSQSNLIQSNRPVSEDEARAAGVRKTF